MMVLEERALLITIACPKEPAQDLDKGPIGAICGSQVSPFILGPQNNGHLCCLARERGQGKNLELLL